MPKLLNLGRVVATRGALGLDVDFRPYLHRHHSGDWGDLRDEDKTTNDLSLISGMRIFSSYHTPAGVKFWIITEADRSLTTILLPEEY